MTKSQPFSSLIYSLGSWAPISSRDYFWISPHRSFVQSDVNIIHISQLIRCQIYLLYICPSKVVNITKMNFANCINLFLNFIAQCVPMIILFVWSNAKADYSVVSPFVGIFRNNVTIKFVFENLSMVLFG